MYVCMYIYIHNDVHVYIKVDHELLISFKKIENKKNRK